MRVLLWLWDKFAPHLGKRVKLVEALNQAIREQEINLQKPPTSGRAFASHRVEQLLQYRPRDLGYDVQSALDEVMRGLTMMRQITIGGNHTTANIHQHHYDGPARVAIEAMKNRRAELVKRGKWQGRSSVQRLNLTN